MKTASVIFALTGLLSLTAAFAEDDSDNDIVPFCDYDLSQPMGLVEAENYILNPGQGSETCSTEVSVFHGQTGGYRLVREFPFPTAGSTQLSVTPILHNLNLDIGESWRFLRVDAQNQSNKVVKVLDAKLIRLWSFTGQPVTQLVIKWGNRRTDGQHAANQRITLPENASAFSLTVHWSEASGQPEMYAVFEELNSGLLEVFENTDHVPPVAPSSYDVGLLTPLAYKSDNSLGIMVPRN